MGSKVKSNGYSVVPRMLSHCAEKGREAEEIRKRMIDDLTNELRPTQENLSYYKTKMSESIKKFERIHNKIERWREDCKQYSVLEELFHSQADELANLKELQRTTNILLLRVRAESAEIITKNYALVEKLKYAKKLNETANEEGAVSSDQIVFVSSQLMPVTVKPHDGAKLPGKVGKKATKIMNAKERCAVKGGESMSTVSKESLKHLTELYKETCKRYEDYIRNLMEFYEEAEIEEINRQKTIENLKTLLEARAHAVEHRIFCITKEFQKVNEEFYCNKEIWQTERERLIDSVNKLCTYVTNGKAFSEEWTIYGGGSSTQRTLSEEIAEEHSELEKKLKAYKDKYETLVEENDWSKSNAERRQILLQKKLGKLGSEIMMQMKNYKELDRRQKLEVEGFLNEIKILQNHLKNVERKITRGCGKDCFVTTSEGSKATERTVHNVKKIRKVINDLLYNLSVMQSDLC
ncbi:coiled-coil domain-containing protein 77-like isoform X3 [Schistocerca cancellata]|nr:coiled-coil domain-containing protein 77-like isoform X3 [Schistocerca cancellata]